MGDEFEVKLKDLNKNASDIVIAKCDFCGKPCSTRYNRYNDIIAKYGNYSCSNCHQQRTLSERQDKMYKQICDFCNKHGYILITQKDEIKTNQSDITYICPKHGEYTTKATNILQGKLCYACSREIAGKKHWDYSLENRINQYYQIAKDKCNELGYVLLSSEGDITQYKDYVKYQCPIHGAHSMRFGNLLSGRHCPDCGHPRSMKIKEEKDIGRKPPKNKLSIEEVIRRIEKCGGSVLNPEDYINQYERNLQILCPRCGNPFVTSLVLFTQHGGQVCSDCYRKESVGERRIRQYLERNQIAFNPEHWFADCRDIKPLPFDFYLYDYNTLIEFDGKQHSYDGSKFFHESYDLEIVKKHDEIKNKYCEDNNIKLIRIPYWELDKIDSILDEELNYSHEDIV